MLYKSAGRRGNTLATSSLPHRFMTKSPAAGPLGRTTINLAKNLFKSKQEDDPVMELIKESSNTDE
jgi:hypothetical protein